MLPHLKIVLVAKKQLQNMSFECFRNAQFFAFFLRFYYGLWLFFHFVMIGFLEICQKHLLRSVIFTSTFKFSSNDTSWKVIPAFLKQASGTKLRRNSCYYIQFFAIKLAIFFFDNLLLTYYLSTFKVVMFRKYIFVRCSLIFRISLEYLIGIHCV